MLLDPFDTARKVVVGKHQRERDEEPRLGRKERFRNAVRHKHRVPETELLDVLERMHHAGNRPQEPHHGRKGGARRNRLERPGEIKRDAVARRLHGIADSDRAKATESADIVHQRVEITVGALAERFERNVFALLSQSPPETGNRTSLQHEVVAVAFEHQKPAEPPEQEDRRKNPPSPEEDVHDRFEKRILVDTRNQLLLFLDPEGIQHGKARLLHAAAQGIGAVHEEGMQQLQRDSDQQARLGRHERNGNAARQ